MITANLEQTSPLITDKHYSGLKDLGKERELSAAREQLENLVLKTESIDRSNLHEFPLESNSEAEDNKKETHWFDNLIQKFTFANAGVNLISELASALSLKNNKLNNSAESLEKVGLITARTQSLGIGINYIKKSLETKNILLLITGFSQAFKLFSGFDRLYRWSGIASGLDSMPFGINPITGKTKYASFGESWRESKAAIKDTMQELFKDPIAFLKYFKINAPKDHTKSIIPLCFGMMAGAVLSNIFDSPVFGIFRKPLTIISSLIRHGTGLLGDYEMSRDESNPIVKQAGLIYLTGAISDFSGLFQENKFGQILHHIGCSLNPIAEIYALQGATEDPPVKTPEPAPSII